ATASRGVTPEDLARRGVERDEATRERRDEDASVRDDGRKLEQAAAVERPQATERRPVPEDGRSEETPRVIAVGRPGHARLAWAPRGRRGHELNRGRAADSRHAVRPQLQIS